jgi:glycine cleavage system H protein
MSEETYEVPDGYFYTKDHEWLRKISDQKFLVGITDYAAKALHDIVYVTLPPINKSFSKSEVFGQVESVKTVSDIYMPISGIVTRSNEKLTKEPEVVSSSPYNEGWMLEVTPPPNSEPEIGDLLKPEEYKQFIHGLSEH